MKPVKDPFPTPVRMKAAGPLEVALKALIHSVKPDIDVDTVVAMIASPANQPKSVIGAEALDVCVKCKQKVWISPSSMSVYKSHLIFCGDCLLNQLKN